MTEITPTYLMYNDVHDCVLLAGYIFLMTPQLEVLKHLGHANFDDNRSAELKRFFHLLLFGMMFG